MNLEGLSKYRIRKKVTLLKMAKSLGLKTAGGYYRIESGDVELRVKQLPIIANVLGLNIFQLIEILFFGVDVDESSINKKR